MYSQAVINYEEAMNHHSLHIQGLVRFRWIAIASLILGTLPLLQTGYLQKNQMPYVMAVVALLAVFNGLTQGIWSKISEHQEQHVLFGQLYVDLFAAAGILFVTGSANNPFIYILCIHAFMGGMFLRGWRGGAFAASALIVLGILQSETYQDSIVTVNFDERALYFEFLSQWVITAVSGAVAYFFSKVLAKQEQRIRLLQEQQHKADRLKSLGALTAGFSHQMATPLNAVNLRVERAARKSANDAATQAELLQAQEALGECNLIFRKMVGVFSNTDANSANVENTNLKSLVNDVLSAWCKDNPGIQVQTQFMNDEATCALQALAFSQTLFDLLDNAAEASAQSSEILLRLYTQNDQVYLEVVDVGHGLSTEILERLGEPFVTNKENGNGLGLYTANLTAQSMGGEFAIFNNGSGKGATARLIIPLGGTL